MNKSLDEVEHLSFETNNDTGPQYVPYSERAETYIIPVLFAIIFVVGVLGNGTLVLIFARHRNIRNVPNTYILSLALGDLLVILSCVPFTSTVYTVDSWPYGEIICKVSEATKDVSLGVSVFTLTVLSADRFFAIVDPLKKLHSSIGGRRATKFTVAVTLTVWMLSIVFSIPALLFSYIRVFVVDNSTSFEVCYPYPEMWTSWYPKTVIMVRFLIYYAVPLTVIGIFYILMARHLIRSTRNLPGEVQGQAAKQVRARKKVAKTVLAFVFVFAVCFLPQHVFMLWFYYHPKAQDNYNDFWHIFRMVGFVLSFINSCVNPIALYCVSGTFRKHFDLYLFRKCKKPKKSRRRYGSTLNARSHTGTKKERTLHESVTTEKAPFQMSTIRKHDIVAAEYTVTTLLNGIDVRNQAL